MKCSFGESYLRKQTTEYSLFFVIPISLYLAYIFSQHLESDMYMSFIDTFDFFVHELGHPLFSIFGSQIIGVLGGTLLQLIIPCICLIGFYLQRDRFAVVFCQAWLGANFFYISTYSSDAQNMALPLMGMGGGDPIHDWNYIFTYFGVLEYTSIISQGFYLIAILFFCLYFFNTFFLIINKRIHF